MAIHLNKSKRLHWMRYFAIVHRGFEKTAADDVSEIAHISRIKVSETFITFETSEKDAQFIAYKCQSIRRLGKLIGEFKSSLEPFPDIRKSISSFEMSELRSGSFRVNCTHDQTTGISCQDLCGQVGAEIIRQYGIKAEMETPDKVVHVHLGNKQGFVGIDYCGFDLSKRDYKIFQHPRTLNGSVAYNFLRLCGLKKGMQILDPFCGAGVIPIEAGLYLSDKSPNLFRKEKFIKHEFTTENLETPYTVYAADTNLASVKATRNNAKIAGLKINATKTDWLDEKYSEQFFDIIATRPPAMNLDDFFEQAKIVLKDNGKLGIISEKDNIQMADFRVKKLHEVYQGKQKLHIFVCTK